MTAFKKISLLLGPILYTLILLFVSPSTELPSEAIAVLAATLWMATWWVTEAVPLPVTALLPLVLFPLSGAVTMNEASAPYASQIIFLFVGGFMLAVAIERWNLHKRVALGIIVAMGTQPKTIILGFMVASAFLSMWISNTATTIMMVPIGVAIVKQLKEQTNEADGMRFAKALLLGIAYAASIGGVATLIGTPTNAIFAGAVQTEYEQEIAFVDWMIFAMPISLVLLGICWIYLVKFGFKLPKFEQGNSQFIDKIKSYQKELGKISYEEKCVLFIFCLVALCWILRTLILKQFEESFPDLKNYLKDSTFAVAGAVILFTIPSKREPQKTVLDWETAVKIPWGVLLLFGGGLSLAKAFKVSGLATFIGEQISLLGGLPLLVLLLLLVAAVNFLTEITSNMATVSMILPILATLALGIDVHPYLLMVGATCAASCAFMLPVATAPNAIVFGSSYIQIKDMIRAGIWLNIISIILFTLYSYFVLPMVWGLDISSFPVELAPK
ncbi:MAG: SLC13 family permease [Saprospiraceae bacterium]|nr:SLC13 family permease [Saprospiraceae bacterium]